MSETGILLFVALAVIALMAILIYVASRRRESTTEVLGEIHRSLDQLLAVSRSIDHTLIKQRRVVNYAHKLIHTAVTKGLQKPTV